MSKGRKGSSGVTVGATKSAGVSMHANAANSLGAFTLPGAATRADRRGGVNARVAVVVMLVVLMAVGLWWLMREDEPQQEGPRPPVVKKEYSVERQAGPEGGRRNRESVPVVGTQVKVGGEAVEAGEVVEGVKEAVWEDDDGPRMTIDGELLPEGVDLLDVVGEVGPSATLKMFTVKFRGKVLATDGSPVVGAVVTARGSFLSSISGTATRKKEEVLLEFRRKLGNTDIEPCRAVSDEQGQYELVVTGSEKLDFERGNQRLHILVTARAKGYAACVARGFQAWNTCEFLPEYADVDIEMSRPGVVSGRVVFGENGMPYGGAGVALTRLRDESGDGGYGKGSRNVSNERVVQWPKPRQVVGADGVFRFEGVADGVYQCWAVWPGMTHAGWRFLAGGAPKDSPQLREITIKDGAMVEDVELVLYRQSKLVFRTDPEVREAPGYEWTTRVMRSYLTNGSRVAYVPARRAIRQDDGSWMVPHLLPSYQVIGIYARGYVMASAKFVVTPGQDLDIGVVPLSLGGIIEGRVLDHAGRVLEGPRVEFWIEGEGFRAGRGLGSPFESMTVGADGKYRFSGLDIEERYVLAASHVGCLPVVKSQERRGPLGAEVLVMDLQLLPASSGFKGRIEFQDGKGLFGAELVSSGMPKPTTHMAVVALDATVASVRALTPDTIGDQTRVPLDLRFDLLIAEDWSFRGNVRPGPYRLVFVYAGETKIIDAEAVAGVETEVVFRMGGLGGIKGRVVGPDGGALADATVSVYGPEGRNFSVTSMHHSQLAATLTTDAYGVFEAKGLKPGKYLIWLPDYPHKQPHPDSRDFQPHYVTVSSSNVAETVINLSKMRGGAAVYLKVSLNGVPTIPRSLDFITITNQGGPGTSGFLTLPDGRAVAAGVRVGVYVVKFTVTPRDRGLDVSDFARFEVSEGVEEVIVNHNTVTGTLAGRVNTGGLEAERMKQVRVRAERMPGSEVTMHFPGSRSVNLKSDGKFDFPALAVGWYRVEVQAPGFATSVQEVEVTGDVQVLLSMGEATGTIRFEYEGHIGVQSEEVLQQVLVRRQQAMVYFTTDAGKSAVVERSGVKSIQEREPGRLFKELVWEHDDVMSGTVTIIVRHPMMIPWTGTVRVSPGKTETVRVRMTLGPKLTVTFPASDGPTAGPQSVMIQVLQAGDRKRVGSIRVVSIEDGSYSGTDYVSGIGEMVLQCQTIGTVSPETEKLTLPIGSTVTHAIRLVPK